MHFTKLIAILSCAALAVAVPAPVAEAAPEAALEARTPPPNACKKGSKYYKYTPACAPKNAFFCQTTALIAIANCVNILNNVNVNVKLTDLIDVVLPALPL